MGQLPRLSPNARPCRLDEDGSCDRCSAAHTEETLTSAFHPKQTLSPVRASARLNPRLYGLLRGRTVAILAPGSPAPFAQAERGKSIMQRIATLACAAFALGMFAHPLGAQQTPAQQPMPEVAQPPPGPGAEPLPPPPPFPPMPSARPSHRWVDMGDHHARRVRHRAAPTHHHATRTQHRRTQAHHRPAHKARPAAHFSRRTIRSCHGMNYRQIMRHSSCRALMSQEIAAAAHRNHRATHRHRTAAHKARQHHAVKRRKR
jgi:hypothetical protein